MEFCRGKQNLYFCNPKILHMKAEEPIAFSEEELDEEISMSMKSGNASQEEIDMVFQRWAN